MDEVIAPEEAKVFKEKFMESHNSMFQKLSLDQMESIARSILETLRKQDAPEEEQAEGGCPV